MIHNKNEIFKTAVDGRMLFVSNSCSGCRRRLRDKIHAMDRNIFIWSLNNIYCVSNCKNLYWGKPMSNIGPKRADELTNFRSR